MAECYAFGPVIIQSEVPLGLPLGQNRTSQLRIELGPVAVPEHWDHHWQDDGRTTMWSASRDGGVVLRIGTTCDAWVSPKLDVTIDSQNDAAAIAEAIEGQVLPRILGQDRHLVVHGSAVTDGRRTALFIGESGSGKSTLAMALHERGWGHLSDDVLIIDDAVQVHPVHTPPKLWADAVPASAGRTQDADHKLPVPVVAHGQPVAATHIFVLDSGPSLELSKLDGSELSIEIVRHAFQLDPRSPAGARSLFERATRLASGVTAWRLELPDQDTVAATVERVLDLLG